MKELADCIYLEAYHQMHFPTWRRPWFLKQYLHRFGGRVRWHVTSR